MENLINDDLNLNSDDNEYDKESDNEFDNGFDIESDDYFVKDS